MADNAHKSGPSKGETAQNVAVDTTGTVAKVTAPAAGAPVIGIVKGLGKAAWRSVGPRR